MQLSLGLQIGKRNLPLERVGANLLRSTVAALAGRLVRRASIEDTIIREMMIKKVNSERSGEAISIKGNDLIVGDEE